MESESVITDYQPRTSSRVLAAAGPVLWIAVSYVDTGKWAAAVEGGTRFGFDLALLLIVINCTAILFQYLSARVAIATDKDLAQICKEEYDRVTCILLGIEAEISMIALDLTMVLSTAYGLNVVFGIDLFNCVFLTSFDAIVFPCLTSLLGNPRAKFSICLASFILVYYFFGVLISQQESSFSMGGMLSKLSGENAYALMGLLGANIMPHNLYLHSSVVQQVWGQTNISKAAMCHDHFFATLCIFSGIFLVNCMLISLAANVFYSSGLVSLTLEDALSLLEQVFRSSAASISLMTIMFFSNQLISLTWTLGRQVITQDLFGLEIPGWLHRATIRIIAIIPALYCVWNAGAEGIFQLLVFTQVVVALLLPSSVIPLFRVASSRSIMGTYKVSPLVEFLALGLFVGMLGLNIVFVIEMIFGSSDWVSSLKCNIGSGVPVLYLSLLVASFASLCLMLLLAITPLKSTDGVDAEAEKWDDEKHAMAAFIHRGRIETNDVSHQLEKALEKQESTLSLEKSFGKQQNLSIPSADPALPETPLDSESNLDLSVIQDSKSETTFFKPAVVNPEAPPDDIALTDSSQVIKSELLDANSGTDTKDMMEKSLKLVEDAQNEKDDEPSPWELVESTKDVSDSSQCLTSEGPGSFRSFTSKTDGVGSGAGSLSQLAGLGRAARRQLTAILDEFWQQLFDFHGQPMQEAKVKKLDVLLGIDSKDSKSSFASVELESTAEECTGYVASGGGRGSDSLRTPNFCNSLKLQLGQSIVGSPPGVQQRASIYSNGMHLSNAYLQNSSHSSLDSGERRYFSLRVPSSSDGYDQQPVTMHGYNFSSSLRRTAKEKGSVGLKGQMEPLVQNYTSSINLNSIDSYGRSLSQKPHGGLRPLTPPGFHNVPVSRNSSMKSERPSHVLYSPQPLDYTNNPPNAKKFYSLPDISGLYIPQPDSSLPGNNSLQQDKYMIYGQSVSQPVCDQTCSSVSSGAGTALGHEVSPLKVCRDAFSSQFVSGSGAGSLWTRQPYEQFGVDKSSSIIQETASTLDVETGLLQSFRSCIIKLVKLDSSDWLFSQNDGADEDIIGRVAAREKFLYEVETRASDTKVASALQTHEADQSKFMSVPNCGEGCVWGVGLIISFGVWCIHRILDLSLVESRPELWGLYTYVLNRLQGIIDLAFSKPRSPIAPCFCLELPVEYQRKPSPPASTGSLSPPSQLGREEFTTAAMLLHLIKNVETAVSGRKGRAGTAASDVAFRKGKENLASVLKRYRRRLLNKLVGSLEPGRGSSKGAVSPPQGS